MYFWHVFVNLLSFLDMDVLAILDITLCICTFTFLYILIFAYIIPMSFPKRDQDLLACGSVVLSFSSTCYLSQARWRGWPKATGSGAPEGVLLCGTQVLNFLNRPILVSIDN